MIRAIRLVIATIAIGCLALSAVVVGAAPAHATPTDLPIVLNLSDLNNFLDSNGDALVISTDQTTDAERTVEGTGTDGSPVHITIYLGAPFEVTASDLADLGANPEPPADPGPTTLNPADLEPRLAVAITATTITVTWNPPTGADTFSLLVDGTVVAEDSVPNFTLTNLESQKAYSLTMQSTHATAIPTPVSDPACAAIETINTMDLANWDLSETRSAGHNEIVNDTLHVYTDEATSLGKAAGYYTASPFSLANVGTAALNWEGSSPPPGLQLVADFDGDTVPDGILVGETAYGNDYWLSNGSAQFVKDGSPDHSGGYGSDNHGTLEGWTTAFPDAVVYAVGYSLGSGVLGDGVIHSILAGCVNYTFGTPVADTPVDTTMYLSVSTLNPEPAPLLRGSFGSPSLEAGAEIHSTEFNYRTFIPYFDLAQSPDPTDQPIAAACAAVDLFNKIPDEHGALTFLGDNRDVAAPTPGLQDYRTMMDYRYNWDTGLPDKQTDVGITKVYDITAGKVIAQDEANKSNMTFLHEVTADNYAAVTFHHVANDPFCPSWLVYGAIVYNVRVEMYRSGLITVYGARNAMPVHEGWVRWNDQQTWSNVFALEARGLKCLAIGPGAPFYCMDRIHASTTRSTDRWTDVSASGGGTLATTASGRSYGWGTNNGGNFLSPYNYAEYCQTDDPLPVPQANASTHRNVQQVFLGRYNSTVLTATGKAYTWGSARFYGANLGRVGIDELATAVSTESFVNVDTSRNGMTTYAVAANGDLYAWGLRIKDLSVISENYYFSPTLVDSSHDFVNVQIGEGYVLALDASGQVWGYGYNNGQLGDLPFDWNGSWTAIPVDGVVFDSFAMEGDTVFALDTVGQLWSWGYPDVPMAGIAPEDAYNLVVEPTLVDTPVEFSYLRGGISKNVSAIAANGDLYSWYDGAGYGALADFALPSPNQPVIDLVDSRAITESGELLQLTSAYVDGQWVLSWLNLGLPPVTTLSNPPFTCNYPS